jgi:hypothetical protein
MRLDRYFEAIRVEVRQARKLLPTDVPVFLLDSLHRIEQLAMDGHLRAEKLVDLCSLEGREIPGHNDVGS